MTATGDEVVDKSRFATLIGRSPGRISQLIAEGKISGAALVGEGRSARIRVAEAVRQLGINLHPGQQLAQAKPIFVDVAPSAHAPAVADAPLLRPQSETEESQARYAKARAEKAEWEAAEMRAKGRARAGTWVDTRDASAAFIRQLRQFVADVDAALPLFAEALATELSVDRKEAVLVLRRVWRDLRTKAAADAREAAALRPEAIPEPVEDEEGDDLSGA